MMRARLARSLACAAAAACMTIDLPASAGGSGAALLAVAWGVVIGLGDG